ncbi:MAG: type II restriction enzyme [Clostridium fessum]
MSLIDDKWRILFDKYRIEREIEKHRRFYITADQIREVKEPRLMTKFDTRESLPRVFGKKISILPVCAAAMCWASLTCIRIFRRFRPISNG